MTEDQKIQLLKDEYLKLQEIYEDFDHRSLTIKGWAITICLGGIAVGFEKENFPLLVISGIASLLFWWVEARWKTFQYAYSYRIRQIEGFFRGDENKKDLLPLQIYNSWFKAYAYGVDPHTDKNDKKTPLQRTFRNARLAVVYTPYLYILIGDLVVIALYFLEIIKF